MIFNLSNDLAILLFYFYINFITYGLYGFDKLAAIKHWRRVSEFTLHIFVLFGGGIGAFLAQRMLRHKVRKIRFQILFWLVAGLHFFIVINLYFLLHLRQTSFL
ncbi:DUF1294 domain-containing protein [Marinomonas agarivorans]|nr:DUF1294 domain-containing protein [Marinomonas agarivorans]